MTLLYIFGVIIIVVSIFLGIILSDVSWKKDGFIKAIIISCLVCMLSIFLSMIINNAYKIGQIDALTGKVSYQLVTEPDSTRTWEEVKGK